MALKKSFEEFKIGDEVEAIVTKMSPRWIFCDINAEKDMYLEAPKKLRELLKLKETVKAKITAIDLEKRQGRVEIPDLEQLVQDRMETPKKFEEFRVGDGVEAVIRLKNRKGTFCDIKAEKNVLLGGNMSLTRLLKLDERVKAKIKAIDLEKRQALIEIPDLEQLVQGRSLPALSEPAQTNSEADGVISVDISGLDLAKVDVDYEKGTIRIFVKSREAGSEAKRIEVKPAE